MTVQKKRSAKGKTRSASRDTSRAAGAQNERADIGWGLGAESDEEDLFMRRVFFAMVVAVLGCMGAWFMVTTVSAGNASRSVLTTTDVPTVHTVKLLDFEDARAKREMARQLVRSSAMQALAGPNKFEVVDLPGHRCALCVGRFEDAASPELARLLREFSEFAVDGERRFGQAAIMPIAR
jgi:hypothetical protein